MYKSDRYWDNKSDAALSQHYPTAAREELLERFPTRSWVSIKKRAARLNLKRLRNSKMDFTVIDSEEKAYLLGFIAADANISDGPRWAVEITLAEKDEEHLLRLRDLLCPDAKLSKSYKPDPRGINNQPRCRFAAFSKELVLQLVRWNLGPRKSLTLEFPDLLPISMLTHWIRGFFDGDGCTSITNGNLGVSFIGTQNVLERILHLFQEVYPAKTKLIRPTGKKLPILSFGGLTAIAFLHWMYQDATIYLERKHQRALPYLEKRLEEWAELSSKTLWATKEIDWLKKEYSKYSRKDLSRLLNKPESAVKHQIKQLGLFEVDQQNQIEKEAILVGIMHDKLSKKISANKISQYLNEVGILSKYHTTWSHVTVLDFIKKHNLTPTTHGNLE
jgi:hypothetical protein